MRPFYSIFSRSRGFSADADLAIMANTLDEDLSDYLGPDKLKIENTHNNYRLTGLVGSSLSENSHSTYVKDLTEHSSTRDT
jgi:transposase